MDTLYLITGAAGYLGGEVCRQMVERGMNARALVLPKVVIYPEFAALSAQEGNCKKPLIYLSRRTATFAAKILEVFAKKKGTTPALTRYEIYNLSRNNNFDSSKARRELGYTSRPYRETIHDEIKWLHKIGKV